MLHLYKYQVKLLNNSWKLHKIYFCGVHVCLYACMHVCLCVCVFISQLRYHWNWKYQYWWSLFIVNFIMSLWFECPFFFFLLLDFDSYVSIIFLLLLIFYLHVWTPHPHTLTDHILKCSHMHACTHTHTHTCIHMHTCIHTHTCMLKYTHNTLFQRFCWSMECPVWYVNNINDLQC